MVVPINNWSNTKKFFNNRRKITPQYFTVNTPQRVTVKANRGRNNTRRFVTRLNYPKVNKVQIVNGIKPSVATLSRSPSPLRASNAEKINVSGHKVTANTLKMKEPVRAELITIKGRPTLKRNYGKRRLNTNNRRNNQKTVEELFTGVIN
jgi:hypothetical protein